MSPWIERCTFPPPGTPLVCGVSGGADSIAMLALACEAGCDATAAHVDHGLRPRSADEAGIVEAAALRLGARFVALRVDIDDGADLEARARAARMDALGPGAAFGHTADDRAETMLVNLIRGSGLDGLTALRPGHRHPILGLRRTETREVCKSHGLEWLEDPSNHDPRFVRNRIRHEVIPLLDDVANRDVAPVLTRTAEVLTADADLLDELAAAIDPTDCRALSSVPAPLAGRALRRWLRAETGGPEKHPPDRASLERSLAVARGEAVACELPGGFRLARSSGRLRLDRMLE